MPKPAAHPATPRGRERTDDHDEHGQDDDGRRVAPRESIDERLHRRALTLRVFDEMDDARDRAVRGEPRRAATSIAPVPLIVPANTVSPGAFLDRATTHR